MKVTPFTILLLLAFYYCPGLCRANDLPSDSLKKIFNNPALADTARARAIVRYVRKQSKQIPLNERISLLDTARKMVEKYDYEKLTVDIIRSKVDAYRAEGDAERINAFKSATDFLFYCQQHHDTLNEARAYFYRGDAYVRFDMYDKAIEEQLKAVNLFDKTKSKFEIAYSNYLEGYYLFNNKKYKESLVYFKIAYQHWLADNANISDMDETMGWIGNAYSGIEQFDSALYYRYKVLNNEAANHSKPGMADCYRYLGNVYQKMGNYDSALAMYRRSLPLFKEAGWSDRFWLVKYFIATVYISKHDYQSSAKVLDEILDTINGCKDFLAKMLAYKVAGEVYYKTGQLEKSIHAYQHFLIIKDSMQASNDAANISEMNIKMQFGQEEQLMQMQQEQQAALAEKDKKHQAFIRNVLIAGFIGLLFFALITYRNFSQKKEANILLGIQNDEITSQKKEIQDSINYAYNIQQATLPDIKEMQSLFSGLFVFYKPKDIVSGDFYWFVEKNGRILIAAADCTGHGVPGAFMSMIGIAKLNDVIQKDGILQPGNILSELNVLVKEVLHHDLATGMTMRDGMDIAMLSFPASNEKSELSYAGAGRPLYIFTNGTLEEIKPTKASIGGHTEDNKQFEQHTVKLKKGDCIYITTDGYADQFGGEKGKKFTTRAFKELLSTIGEKPMYKQQELIEQSFIKWKGSNEQVDDILIIGIQV